MNQRLSTSRPSRRIFLRAASSVALSHHATLFNPMRSSGVAWERGGGWGARNAEEAGLPCLSDINLADLERRDFVADRMRSIDRSIERRLETG